MSHFTPRQLLLSHREYEALREAINDSITDDPRFVHLSPVQKAKRQPVREKQWAADIRAATRVYLAVNYGLKGVQALLAQLSARRSPAAAQSRKPLIASPQRFATSLALLLALHRFLYRVISGVRRTLLSENVKRIRQRWPITYDLLTSKLTPAFGASLSGLALGICPRDQLRVTIVIYVLVRAGELVWKGAEAAGYLKNKPRWFGSWMLFALAQGQLMHAFVFDPDCFPQAYGDFILNHTPEYLQPRPEGLSQAVVWPAKRDVVDSLAQMARLRWPSYVSPILRPKDLTTLPASINPVINPITSRAHPAIQHLSCALLHPSETSCFTPFLRQILLSFRSIGKTMTLYYGAFSILRIRKAFKQPIGFIAGLLQQILKVTAVVVGSIAGTWGSICFFNNYLPKSFMPRSRFFLGGALGGCLSIIDRSPTGHENAMWWKGVKGGDVYIFVVALAALNMLYDAQRPTFAQDRTMAAVRLLRGEIEVSLKENTEADI
ncbi:hypothetical protein LTR70_007073 [Exophiala xenobiotica]|nr:hypothetical protein LTR70_007073 [Exophiala xenobiotica]